MVNLANKAPGLRYSIARKFVLWLVAGSIVVTAAGGCFEVYFFYKKHVREVDRAIQKVGTAYKNGLVNSLWVANHEMVEIQLEGLLQFPHIDYVEIRKDGRVRQAAGQKPTDIFAAHQIPLSRYYNDRKIELGSLYIAIGSEKIYQELKDMVGLIFVSEMFHLSLIAVFLYFLFHFLVGRHLRTMADYTEQVDVSRLDTPLELKRSIFSKWEGDELDQLVSSINTMCSNLAAELVKRRVVQEELKAAEKRYRRLFKDAPTMYVATYLNEGAPYIEDCNDEFLAALGYERSDVIGRPLARFYSEDSQKKLRTGGYKSDSTSNRAGEVERVLVKRDGSFMYTVLKASVRTNDGQHGSMAMFVDVTARKQAEAEKNRLKGQLVQAQKMEAIGTMAGGIAHDFNNILAIILGYTDLACEDIPEGSVAREELGAVIDAANRAKDLVRQILTFSRRTEQEQVPTRVQLVVKDTLKLLRATIPTTIKVNHNIDDKCGTIMADPTQINQVVMNLCVNAVDAMQEKGALEVSLGETVLSADDVAHRPDMVAGRYVRLSVSDTGTGIDKTIADRIFDPFFTTKELGQGTGMGLSMVHGIVIASHGMIKIDSRPGQGATFHVFFPVVQIAENASLSVDKDLPGGTERIFFIDDEEAMVTMGGRTLQRYGYEVTTETSSTRALELFRKQPNDFDLVFTDQTMPDLTGAELAAEMLKIRPDIPIILCTGHSKTIAAAAAKEIGIREFCLKPLERKQLTRTVRQVLDKDRDQ